MGRQSSNGWFSPPQERTSSFERASATNATRNSLPAAHEQPFGWKALTTSEPARFAQGSKKAMKMTRMKKVKRRDALYGVFELRWANVLQTRKAQVGAPKGAWCIGNVVHNPARQPSGFAFETPKEHLTSGKSVRKNHR